MKGFKMLVKNESLVVEEQIKSPKQVFEILKTIIYYNDSEDEVVESDREHFFAIGLDTSNKIKYVDIVSIGTLNATLSHPREVYRFAVLKGCNSIIIAHNHPSGNLKASQQDNEITERLRQAGEILQIKLTDSIIFSKTNFVSII